MAKLLFKLDKIRGCLRKTQWISQLKEGKNPDLAPLRNEATISKATAMANSLPHRQERSDV